MLLRTVTFIISGGQIENGGKQNKTEYHRGVLRKNLHHGGGSMKNNSPTSTRPLPASN